MMPAGIAPKLFTTSLAGNLFSQPKHQRAGTKICCLVVFSFMEGALMFKKFKSEKGQAMLEFALILPILLALVCGIIDFGWLFYNQSELNNCAREGARYAIVNTGKSDRIALIQNKVNNMASSSIKPMTITITYSNTQTPLMGDVTVTLSSNVKVLTPLTGVFVENQQVALTAQATMKVES